MTRQQKRALVILGIFAAGVFFIWLGQDGWAISSVPGEYVGYFTIGIGAAGMFGVNIWSGGPLDPRNDPKPERGADPRGTGQSGK